MTNLDKYQKRAVLEDGDILLIAGAGSGKTFTITKKIEYLIKEKHILPREILVISFTNKSVLDLKKKINYNIKIKTFHKLAIDILNLYNINYKICSSNLLSYIIDEYFNTLDNNNILEILSYFHHINYDNFLKSRDYLELKKLIENFIKLFKTNNKTKNELKIVYNKNNIISKHIFIIMAIYNNELSSTNSYDFDDLIIKATNILNKNLKFKYIFVDEFQDTSLIRFNLLLKIKNLSNAFIFAVGDDYQSIYNFTGANINLFLNFKKLIPNSKILYLPITYRNSQELINICKTFICKNKSQFKKELKSSKRLNNPIEFIYYVNPFKALKKALQKTNYKALILGRNNFDIYKFSKDKNINYMTIHSSKGLESDNVILINLTNNLYGFPSKIKNNKLLKYINNYDNSYLYAEERRLFYVALTRTKNKVYILVPLIKKSIFIKELKNIIKTLP